MISPDFQENLPHYQYELEKSKILNMTIPIQVVKFENVLETQCKDFVYHERKHAILTLTIVDSTLMYNVRD